MNIRIPTIKRETVTEVTTTTNRRISTRSTPPRPAFDPMAQTFIVNKSRFPEGVFLKSVDLWFRQKATANSSTPQPPVTVQIRPIINGYPSSGTILPFAEVVLRPEEVNAQTSAPDASNSSHYTTFDFPAPVYLPGDEYALVVLSNSSEYQLFLYHHLPRKIQLTLPLRLVIY